MSAPASSREYLTTLGLFLFVGRYSTLEKLDVLELRIERQSLEVLSEFS